MKRIFVAEAPISSSLGLSVCGTNHRWNQKLTVKVNTSGGEKIGSVYEKLRGSVPVPPKEYPLFVTFREIRGADGDDHYAGGLESHRYGGEGTDFIHVASYAYVEDARRCYFKAAKDNHHLRSRQWWAA